MNKMILKSEAVYVDNVENYNWFDNIDLSLGERQRRYLGSGYKKVGYKITDIKFNIPEKTVAATASVFYPEDWSQKSGEARKDFHLSTIDILLLSCRIGEVILSCGWGLSAQELQSSRVLRVEMDLGREPTTQLQDLRFAVKYCGSTCRENIPHLSISKFEVRIGKAIANIQIEHPASKNSDPFSALSDKMLPLALNIANDTNGKYYGDGYQTREIEHTDLLVNKKENAISCFLRIREENKKSGTAAPQREFRGMGGAMPEAVEVLDLMLSSAQLSQIMIYSFDNIERDKTRNLWMTSFSVYCNDCMSGIGSLLPATLKVKNSKLVSIKGKQFRITYVEYNIIGTNEVGARGRFVLEI